MVVLNYVSYDTSFSLLFLMVRKLRQYMKMNFDLIEMMVMKGCERKVGKVQCVEGTREAREGRV